MIAIFSGSSVSSPTVTNNVTVDFAAHKTAHVIEYAILAVLLFRALRQEKINVTEAVIYAILIAGFYGFTDEFHQSFTAHRTTRLRDVFIDTIGATAGVLIVWKLLPKMPKKLLDLAKKLDLI
ncbi:MAG TPA: VanZ family protein [Patescibacteria group bacterium]|nr:VanZ family protein [Patescibacteria group bacterium]